MSEKIPPADPDQAFRIRTDRAIGELEAAARAHPLTMTQMMRLRILTEGK